MIEQTAEQLTHRVRTVEETATQSSETVQRELGRWRNNQSLVSLVKEVENEVTNLCRRIRADDEISNENAEGLKGILEEMNDELQSADESLSYALEAMKNSNNHQQNTLHLQQARKYINESRDTCIYMYDELETYIESLNTTGLEQVLETLQHQLGGLHLAIDEIVETRIRN